MLVPHLAQPTSSLLWPGRHKAVLPAINWSFLSGSPSRHGAPCPGGHTLSTSPFTRTCLSLTGDASPANRKRPQRTEGPAEAARGARSPLPSRPASHCGEGSKSRDSHTVHLEDQSQRKPGAQKRSPMPSFKSDSTGRGKKAGRVCSRAASQVPTAPGKVFLSPSLELETYGLFVAFPFHHSDPLDDRSATRLLGFFRLQLSPQSALFPGTR